METVYNAFVQSDFFGQFIVLLLLGVSVYAWTVMLSKRAFLSVAMRRDAAFLRRFRQSVHPAQLYVRATNGFVRNVPSADIYAATMKELLNYLHRNGVTDEAILDWKAGFVGPALPESEMASVRAAAEGALSARIVALESKMTMLATCTSTAPSLGLLGTVWGIMRAFMEMMAPGSGSIDLARIAPSISSALLTTVAGLVVSIPSAVGYNFLSDRVHRRTVALETFTDELLADIVRIHGASATPSLASPPPAAAPVVIQTAPAPVAYAPAPAPAPYAPPPAPSPAPYAPSPAPAPAPYAPSPAPAPAPYSPPPAPDTRF